MPESPQTLTPTQLNRDVRRLLESHYDYVWVEGELSNFARPSSGHWYFTLKDDSAQVRCAMFRNRNQRVRIQPENGDLVRLRARVSLYEGRGDFQLIGEFMEAAGAGLLQARFDALREKLRAEGLFDSERKQALPAKVSHLAVVTSPTGAALQDILQVLARRNPAIRVTVLPSPVQGEGAAEALCAAVERAGRLRAARADCDFDALILARGGGSLEDLWAFNDEALARAIVASPLPVVVGVGHEVDITIADFAADQRAPTPSAAAEILSDDLREIGDHLVAQRRRLARAMQRHVEHTQLRLEALGARLRHPGDRLREQAQRVDDLEQRLRRTMGRRLQDERRREQMLEARLRARSPLPRVRQAREHLARLRRLLDGGMRQSLDTAAGRVTHHRELLASLNPLAILGRGYAILATPEGRVVRSAQDVEKAQRLEARLAQGRLDVEVLDTRPEATGVDGASEVKEG